MSSVYADNPSRWLVIFNQSLADSVTWAQWYAQKRGVPSENLLGLSLAAAETITEAAFETLRSDVAAYLDSAGLDEQVIGILCGHGVPGYYTRSDGQTESIATQLQSIDQACDPLANPTNASGQPVRPTRENLGNCRLTARLDGPNLTFTEALSDRADQITTTVPLEPQSCHLFLDTSTVAPALAAESQRMADWARSLDAQRLRLPIDLIEPTEPAAESGYDSISADGFYWGWNESHPASGFFASPAGPRVFCLQPSPAVLTCPTLRDEHSGSWVMGALVGGYGGSGGISRPVSLSAIPRIDWFFGALREGWNLGEAWFAALPLLREGPTLVGDPLMKVFMPKAGWNVYGPFAESNDVQTTAPLAMLPSTQTSFAIGLSSRPAPDEQAMYLVRRVDEYDRPDGALLVIRLTNHAGIAAAGPDLPIWPSHVNWMPRRVDQSAELLFRFASQCRDGKVHRVDLLEQIEGGAAEIVESIEVDYQALAVSFTRPIGSTPRRFRIAVYSKDQVMRLGPYSAWVALPSVDRRNIQATSTF